MRLAAVSGGTAADALKALREHPPPLHLITNTPEERPSHDPHLSDDHHRSADSRLLHSDEHEREAGTRNHKIKRLTPVHRDRLAGPTFGRLATGAPRG